MTENVIFIVKTYKCAYRRDIFENLHETKSHGPLKITKQSWQEKKRKKKTLNAIVAEKVVFQVKSYELRGGKLWEQCWNLKFVYDHLVQHFKTHLPKPITPRYAPPYVFGVRNT